MWTPKLTICMNTYNRARYVSQSIPTVLSQSFDDFELIVLDAASPDNTEEVVRSLADRRIVYVRTETRIGMTEGWMRCLAMARGEYVAILSDDDLYFPSMLEVECEVLNHNPRVGFVHSAFCLFGDDEKVVRVAYPAEAPYIREGRDEFKRHIVGKNYVCTQTVLFRKNAYQACGGLDPCFLQVADWDLWLRMELHGCQVAYVNEPLAAFRIHSGSITSRSLSTGSVAQELFLMFAKILGSKEFRQTFTLEEAERLTKDVQRNMIRHLCYFAFRSLQKKDIAAASRYLGLLFRRKGLRERPSWLTVFDSVLRSGADYGRQLLYERTRDRGMLGQSVWSFVDPLESALGQREPQNHESKGEFIQGKQA
jgi:glycosyltransferase involved in cell wall biosynthesis